MSTEDKFTPFLANTYPLSLLQERAKLINSMVRYVTHSWRDIYSGKMDPGVAKLHESVQGAMARPFMEYHDMSKALRAKIMRDPVDTAELVLDAYAEAIRFMEPEFIAVPHFSDEALMDAFAKRFHLLPLAAQVVSVGEEAEPTARRAVRAGRDRHARHAGLQRASRRTGTPDGRQAGRPPHVPQGRS